MTGFEVELTLEGAVKSGLSSQSDACHEVFDEIVEPEREVSGDLRADHPRVETIQFDTTVFAQPFGQFPSHQNQG